MTMQIGIVGRDGIVLASDTQWTSVVYRTQDAQPIGRPMRYIKHSTKIKTNDKIAVSYAQDKETSYDTAEAILARFPCENPEAAIREIAESIPSEDRRDVQGLIAVPPFELFRFQIAWENGEWTPSCEPDSQFDIAGDTANPSMFWIHRFYQAWLTVEQLIPLAAHLITSSHLVNTGGIGGLEIATCKVDEITLLPRERTIELAKEAWERDTAITEMIFGKGVSL